MVVDFGTNRKRVCNFLSVINSNLPWSYVTPFQRYYRFAAKTTTPPLFYAKFRVFLLDYIADIEASGSEDTMLIIRAITCELTQP